MLLSKDGIIWLLYRRAKVVSSVNGLFCHWDTYLTKDVRLGEYVNIKQGSKISSSEVGRFTRINGSTLSHVDVGAFCSFAPRCHIGGGGDHPLNQVSTADVFYMTDLKQHPKIRLAQAELFENRLKRTHIGHDVWVGAGATIKHGVNIGTGSVIGAGAMVVDDVPPYAIVVGVPARIIKYRHSEEVREALLESRWWTWNIEQLKVVASYYSEDESLSMDRFREIEKVVKRMKDE